MSGLSFTAPMGDIEKLYPKFIKIFNEFNSHINFFIEKAKKNSSLTDDPVTLKQIYLIESRIEFLNENCIKFFNDKKDYIFYKIVGKDFFQYIQIFFKVIDQVSSEITSIDIGNVLSSIQEIFQVFNTIRDIVANEAEAKNLIYKLEEQVEIATENVKSIISSKEEIDNKLTEEIYSEASARYLESARNYEWIFYLIFIAAVLVTIVSFIHFPHKTTDIVDFILYKVLTVSVVVTIGTIFLRKASHLRKLHDQAYQTSLELQALPLYLKNVKIEDHSEIYKNLAEKYFGKEIDQTQNDKIGDMLQDQVKTGTELIRASAEMVRSVKPNSTEDK